MLAFAAQRNNDKVGLTLFTERVEKYVAPAKGTGMCCVWCGIFSGTHQIIAAATYAMPCSICKNRSVAVR